MAEGAVSWNSIKQGCVAQSSSEAEYMALASAVKEAIWASKLIGFCGSQSETSSALVYVDNQGAINTSKNDSSSTRTKHIDMLFHFVCDSLSKKMLSTDYCPTNKRTADLLTEPLQRFLLEKLKVKLGIVNL